MRQPTRDFLVLNWLLESVVSREPEGLGVRLGNWLTAEQARTLWQLPNAETVKGKRDRAILSILLGCGLRRRELAELTLDHLQQREDHWAVVDLIGKAGHIRTVPVPDWVKQITDEWVVAAGVGSGRVFRCVSRSGTVWGEGHDREGGLVCS